MKILELIEWLERTKASSAEDRLGSAVQSEAELVAGGRVVSAAWTAQRDVHVPRLLIRLQAEMSLIKSTGNTNRTLHIISWEPIIKECRLCVCDKMMVGK